MPHTDAPPLTGREFGPIDGLRDSERPPQQPLVQCAPWCAYGDGHPGNFAREDQWCGSESLSVRLSRHPDQEMSDNTTEPSKMVVFAMQHPDQAVYVALSHDGGPEVEFTPSEARQLVARLNATLAALGDFQ